MFLLVIVMVKHLIVVDIAGLEPRLISEDRTPNISSLSAKGELVNIRPVFPAVTCTSQASMLSGTYPRQHGIISNGLYDRQTHTVSFWEQSSSLVQAEKVWDIAKKGGSGRTTAAFLAEYNVCRCRCCIDTKTSSYGRPDDNVVLFPTSWIV